MTRYVYKMIQVATGIVVSKELDKDNAAASYLENIVNQMSRQGWEFYRVDNLTVSVRPGCLSALFGQREPATIYNVITFRRQLKASSK